jgi:hypothetical protein
MKQHIFVVTTQKDRLRPESTDLEHAIDDLFGGRPSIDVITHKDEKILWAHRAGSDQMIK